MTTIARPQPLGAFPLPAGLLLVAGEGADAARAALLEGVLPESWPPALEGVRLAHTGAVAEAIEVCANDEAPWSRYNLFVLDPERTSRDEVVAALGEEWRPLVDHVAFTLGLTSVPPSPAETDGELRALLLTAQAAAALDDEDEDAATALLGEAADAARAVHPVFAGVLQSEYAARAHDLEAAEEAVRLLKHTALTAQYAEALYQRAGLVHGLAIDGRRPLTQAIAGYVEALKYLNERDHAPLYARVHMNLGIAYLAGGAGVDDDPLRSGIAVQSLRTAARLLDEQSDREEWACAPQNHANALVYARSARQHDNLMEAVDLYERVLRTRTAKGDPLGRARVLANQGNALAHLGLREDAASRLAEAEYLFAAAGDEQSAAVVRSMTGELAVAAATVGGEERQS